MTTTYYKLTPPTQGAKPFLVRIEDQPKIQVYSNQNGTWQPETRWRSADIVLPMHGPLYDWDVEKVESDAPDLAE